MKFWRYKNSRNPNESITLCEKCKAEGHEVEGFDLLDTTRVYGKCGICDVEVAGPTEEEKMEEKAKEINEGIEKFHQVLEMMTPIVEKAIEVNGPALKKIVGLIVEEFIEQPLVQAVKNPNVTSAMAEGRVDYLRTFHSQMKYHFGEEKAYELLLAEAGRR